MPPKGGVFFAAVTGSGVARYAVAPLERVQLQVDQVFGGQVELLDQLIEQYSKFLNYAVYAALAIAVAALVVRRFKREKYRR